MKESLKVMILENCIADQKMIRDAVLSFKPQSLFLTAGDKASFLTKMNWFSPDLILANFLFPDFSGLQALVGIKQLVPEVPLVFISKTTEAECPMAKVVLQQADHFIFKENLQELANQLKILFSSPKNKAYASKIEKAGENRIKLLKAIHLLDAAPDFSQKSTLLDLLKSLQESNN